MRLYAQAARASRKKEDKKRKKPRASWQQHATNQCNCGGRPVPRFSTGREITRGGKASKRFQQFERVAQFNLFKPPTTLPPIPRSAYLREIVTLRKRCIRVIVFSPSLSFSPRAPPFRYYFNYGQRANRAPRDDEWRTSEIGENTDEVCC